MANVDRRVGGTAQADEIEQLHARIDELQTQLIETEAWANRAVAESEAKVYWLDRWHIDLNAVMERPGADEFRAAVRGTRAVYRFLKRAKSSFR